MNIVYIGNKPIKADNIAGTGLTWQRGETHEVADLKKAELLISFKDIWADADKEFALITETAIPKDNRPAIVFNGDEDNKHIVYIPTDIVNKLKSGELLSIFMTVDDADEFEMWKLSKDTAPKVTGPTIQNHQHHGKRK